MCIFTSYEYVGITSFSQCVSLIELNAWKDEWLFAIEALQEGKKKAKKWFSFWAIRQCSPIGCTMRWVL